MALSLVSIEQAWFMSCLCEARDLTRTHISARHFFTGIPSTKAATFQE